jgi:hypothetical protein
MPTNKPESGVCIVTRRHLGHNLHQARPNGKQHFTDPDAAGRSVAEFIRSFAGPTDA